MDNHPKENAKKRKWVSEWVENSKFYSHEPASILQAPCLNGDKQIKILSQHIVVPSIIAGKIGIDFLISALKDTGCPKFLTSNEGVASYFVCAAK